MTTTQPVETAKAHSIIINAVVWGLACIFAIVGTCTYVYHLTGTNISMWHACSGGHCTKIDHHSVPCDKQWSLIQAERAFAILSCITAFVVALCFAMIYFNRGIIVGRLTLLVLMVFGLIFLALAWILEAAGFSEKFCDNPSFHDDGGHLVTSFGFFVTAFGIAALATIIYCLKP